MIIITKQDAKHIKKLFPNFDNGKTMENKYGIILERYLIRTQKGKSNRGKYVLTTSIQFDRDEFAESKIAKLDELMAIMKLLRGNEQAKEAYDNLKVEKYKLEHIDWWDKSKGVKHPFWFAKSMKWIKSNK